MRAHGWSILVRYRYLDSRKQARDRNIGLLSKNGSLLSYCV
jgi:hypothetical protein